MKAEESLFLLRLTISVAILLSAAFERDGAGKETAGILINKNMCLGIFFPFFLSKEKGELRFNSVLLVFTCAPRGLVAHQGVLKVPLDLFGGWQSPLRVWNPYPLVCLGLPKDGAAFLPGSALVCEPCCSVPVWCWDFGGSPFNTSQSLLVAL